MEPILPAAGGWKPREAATNQPDPGIPKVPDQGPAHSQPEAQPVGPPVSDRVSIEVDRQLSLSILRITDPETGEVLRQIPSAEAVQRRRAYQQHHQPDPGEPGHELG